MKKVLSLVLCLALLSMCFVGAVSADEEPEEVVDNGFVNVMDFGANGADKKDDSAAFEAALATGKNIYVPRGNFYVAKTIRLTDRILRGSAAGKTKILGIMTDVKAPVILMEGCSSISDLEAGYPTKSECRGVKAGEKVIIQAGSAEKPLTEGSTLRGLYLNNGGTNIYSPADAGCNGVLFDNMEISAFTFRAIDMQSENRLMNSFSNCYVTSYLQTDKEELTDCGIALEGSSFGETLHQMNVEHDEYMNSISIKNAKGFNFASIHLEGVCLRKADTGYVYFENSTGHIGAISTFYTRVVHMNNSVFYFGDANAKTGDVVTVGIMHNKSFNQFDVPSHPFWEAYRVEKGYSRGLKNAGPEADSFRIFGRAKNAKGKYSIIVDYHSYYSFSGGVDADYYTIYDNAKNLSVNVKAD